MSLTAVQPDRELLDALSLDAAWERAKSLEAERDEALAGSRASQMRAAKWHDRYAKLSNGVGLLLWEYESNPRSLAEYMTELAALLRKADAIT